MKAAASLVLVLLTLPALTVTPCGSQSVDLTLTPDSQGAAVVQAVVDRIRERCIFPDDKLFLRRMAYVESLDGADPSTYTSGFHGGIWKVSQTVFLITQLKRTSSYIAPMCQTILTNFGIDWSTVTWSDLRKPLYSGLAAALYSVLLLAGNDMPEGITQQAQFWSSTFGGTEADFVSLAGNATDSGCSEKLDLVFILDSSGSISNHNFNLMRNFAADVVDVMNITSEEVRVADVVYGSAIALVADLDDYTDKTSLRNRLLTTPKLGGGTLTNYALDAAALTLYETSLGARDDVKKVAILVTDGKSHDITNTIDAAQTLKDKGTTVFAIGVGNYNETEVHAVASDPSCAHVFTLTSFASIQSILTQIQTSTCDASLVLTPGSDVSGEIADPPVEVVTKTLNPGPNRTIVANVTCGTLDLYVSYTDTRPGPTLYEEKYNASHNSPGVIVPRPSVAQGSPVYVTVVGTRLTQNEAMLLNCSQYSWTLSVEDPAYHVRLVDGSRESQGRVEVFSGGVWGSVCDDDFDTYDAMVVCRALGYTGVVPEVTGGAPYGAGTGTIWLDNLGCTGGEASVFQCSHNGLAVHDCSHSEDVGVDCQPDNATSIADVRLVNGSRSSEGRVEVLVGGTWGTVCHDDFDVNDATVICSMLGYSGVTPEVHTGAYYGEGTGTIWLDGVRCSGTEASIFLCPHNGLAVHDCSHSQDVGIDCEPPATSASSTGAADNTPVIAGTVAGVAVLGVGVAAAVAYAKFVAGKSAVTALKVSSYGQPPSQARPPNTLQPGTGESDPPIPGLTEVPDVAQVVPRDTRLPPLTNSFLRFPALRL